MGEEPLEETKEQRERVGMMGELLTRHREHSGLGLSIKLASPPLLKHTHTHTPVLFYPSPDAPGGIQATPKITESQMYECVCE